MFGWRAGVVLLGILSLAPLFLNAAVVQVENPAGSVTVNVAAVGELGLSASSPRRDLSEGDVRIARGQGVFLIESQPADGVPIDLKLTLPYGVDLRVRTGTGRISISGLVSRADLTTESGDIELAAPWEAMQLNLRAEAKPKEYVSPTDTTLAEHSFRSKGSEEETWELEDRHADLRITYGRIAGQARDPGRVIVRDLPFPADAPVRLPWQAPGVLERLLQPSPVEPEPPRSRPAPLETGAGLAVDEGGAIFRSDVRLVNMTVAAYDAQGRPLTGLGPDDFEVLEDDTPQEIAFAGSDDVTFNLALLLDLSGSIKQNRGALREAALRFLDIARPRDRIAVYALADNMFHVVSPLTSDREKLRALIESIPEVSGGTPLYDAITFAYDLELHGRSGERNGLIVISDGVDNQLHGIGAASEVSFRKLERAAAEMNALVYPILLESRDDEGSRPGWAKKAFERMQRLAEASGGEVFPAQSVSELEAVYPKIAEELRSVYQIGYYPTDQDFDGAWRKVITRINTPGARVRARKGYFAR